MNRKEFLGALVFDEWIGNADARQSIFFRARLQPPSASDQHPLRSVGAFVACMLDHGYVFDGFLLHWTFSDSPLQALFSAGRLPQSPFVHDFSPGLNHRRAEHFPEEVVDEAQKQLPPEWIAGDESALEALLVRLMSRCRRVPDLIRQIPPRAYQSFPGVGIARVSMNPLTLFGLFAVAACLSPTLWRSAVAGSSLRSGACVLGLSAAFPTGRPAFWARGGHLGRCRGPAPWREGNPK